MQEFLDYFSFLSEVTWEEIWAYGGLILFFILMIWVLEQGWRQG